MTLLLCSYRPGLIGLLLRHTYDAPRDICCSAIPLLWRYRPDLTWLPWSAIPLLWSYRPGLTGLLLHHAYDAPRDICCSAIPLLWRYRPDLHGQVLMGPENFRPPPRRSRTALGPLPARSGRVRRRR